MRVCRSFFSFFFFFFFLAVPGGQLLFGRGNLADGPLSAGLHMSARHSVAHTVPLPGRHFLSWHGCPTRVRVLPMRQRPILRTSRCLRVGQYMKLKKKRKRT